MALIRPFHCVRGAGDLAGTLHRCRPLEDAELSLIDREARRGRVRRRGHPGDSGHACTTDIGSAAMRIHVSGNPELVRDLRDHLRGVGCIAVEVAPGLIEATVPDAPSAAQERRELGAYLATWTASRGVEADLEE